MIDNDIRKTAVMSVYSGCGKTWLTENQGNMAFDFPTCSCRQLKIRDADSSQYSKGHGWEKKYVNDILKCKGKYDFVFVTMHDVVLQEMVRRNIPFVMVMPRNFNVESEEERMFIKQQFFGRIVLRDNSFIKHDFTKWITHLSEKYDNWITEDTVKKYHPADYVLLPTADDEWYLADIIQRWVWKKEIEPWKYCL